MMMLYRTYKYGYEEYKMDAYNKLLPDEVYDDLLDKILKREWKIGDRIPSENQICQEYGISRVSARSAIQKLREQNMVVTRPGRGTFVIANHIGENIISNMVGKMDLSQNEFRYIVELRKALEFTSIDLMTQYGDEADFEKLHTALINMKASREDVNAYVNADYKFHLAMIEGSHNPLFVSVINGCKDALMKYFKELALASSGNYEQSIINHQRIYEAVKSRDPDEVKNIIENTFEYNLKRFRNAFKESNETDA